jgi:hypothetical protein
MTARTRRRLRAALLVAIVCLYGASIPWYREGGSETGLLWGLPSWVAIAIGCYVLAACANALAWWLTEIPDAPDPGEGAG